MYSASENPVFLHIIRPKMAYYMYLEFWDEACFVKRMIEDGENSGELVLVFLKLRFTSGKQRYLRDHFRRIADLKAPVPVVGNDGIQREMAPEHFVHGGCQFLRGDALLYFYQMIQIPG